jgi:hypothetical protein
MNFPEIVCQKEVEMLAPPPLTMLDKKRRHRR